MPTPHRYSADWLAPAKAGTVPENLHRQKSHRRFRFTSFFNDVRKDPDMFNLQQMMKQAQKMQDQMKDIQGEMERTEFTGTAGGGAVTIVCNGKYEFKQVKIKEDALSDRDMLEDMIMAALKDVSGKVTSTMEEKMSAITSGLNIPGLKLPF
jgi:DNA-binding YbaB/EbfC family protein